MKTLHIENGVKISELVKHLRAEYLDRGLDGEVWIANTDDERLTNQMATASLLNRSDVCFDIRRLDKKTKDNTGRLYDIWL